MANEGRIDSRVERLGALAPGDREALARIVGEAALDLWSLGLTCEDLVDRCLEAVEEDIAEGRVPVRPLHA